MDDLTCIIFMVNELETSTAQQLCICTRHIISVHTAAYTQHAHTQPGLVKLLALPHNRTVLSLELVTSSDLHRKKDILRVNRQWTDSLIINQLHMSNW